jgi:hypothetical protein
MGSWNNTCGLTNLPIISGEEVYVFPIQEVDNSKYRSHCYSTALYKPMMVPFVAKYNDYGAGEECSGVALDLFVEEMRRELVELEVGENQYHDIAVKRDDFDIDKFFEAVHKYRMFVKGWGTTDRPVYFTMIRKDVADRMWKEWTFDQYKGSEGTVPEGFESDQYYIKNVTYAKIAAMIPEYLAAISKVVEQLNNEEITIDRYIIGSLLLRNEVAEKFLLDGIFRYFGHHDFWDLLNTKECIIKYIMSGDLDRAEEFIRNFIIGIMINHMMESTRRIWLPVMHQGSQSEEYAEYRFLNSLANDVITARESEFEDDNGEDDLFSTVGIYLGKERAAEY